MGSADQQRAVVEALGLSPDDLRQLAKALEVGQQIVLVSDVALAEIAARPRHHRYTKSLQRWIEWAGGANAAEVRNEEIAAWARRAGDCARADSRGTHGIGAEQAFVHAVRAAYRRVVAAGTLSHNPADDVPLPDRPPSRRTALSPPQLRQVHVALVAHSRDPELDDVVFQLLRETACRRGGAMALANGDLAPGTRVVRLVEKYGKQRWVPVSAHLMSRLVNRQQPHRCCDRVLHRRRGGHLNPKWFEGFGRRLQELTWSHELGVTAHWLRHTTLTDIERVAGVRVAATYAGHSDRTFGVTGIYTKPSLDDLRLAHECLFFDSPSHAADPTVHPHLYRRPLPVGSSTIRFSTA